MVTGTALSRGARNLVIALVVVAVAGLTTVGTLFDDDAPHWLGAIGLTVLIVCFTSAIVLSRRLRHAVIVRDDAVVEQPRGTAEIAIRWDEPHDLFLDGVQLWVGPVPTARQMTATVRARDGRRIQVHEAAFFNRGVPAVIQQHSTQANLRRFEDQLARGTGIDFGPIQLTRDELIIKRKRVPLGDLVDLRIDDGKLRIKLRSAWLATKIPLRKIANYECLMRLAKS